MNDLVAFVWRRLDGAGRWHRRPGSTDMALHEVIAKPVAGSSAAILFLVCPPIISKSPPAYIFPLYATIALTMLFALGSHGKIVLVT